MNDEGLADAAPPTPFVYPDFTQECARGPGSSVTVQADMRSISITLEAEITPADSQALTRLLGVPGAPHAGRARSHLAIQETSTCSALLDEPRRLRIGQRAGPRQVTDRAMRFAGRGAEATAGRLQAGA